MRFGLGPKENQIAKASETAYIMNCLIYCEANFKIVNHMLSNYFPWIRLLLELLQ